MVEIDVNYLYKMERLSEDQIRRLMRLLLCGPIYNKTNLLELLIQQFKTTLMLEDLKNQFFDILNELLLPVESIMKRTEHQLDELNTQVFVISIIVLATIKHIVLSEELLNFEQAVEVKLKEMSSDNFNVVLMFIHEQYPLHRYVSPLADI